MNSRGRILVRMTASLLVPAIPTAAWYYTAVKGRQERQEQVRTRVRVPNIQTIDELMIEKCKPGDILLFDRRCYKCAAGPLAALSCLMAKSFLCDEERQKNSSAISGFEHVGIVVPGYENKVSDRYDPSNLLLLEATASEGIVARPLLQRLEMTQSRSVLLLRLASPGEQRNDPSYEPSLSTQRLHKHVHTALEKFRDTWITESKKQRYEWSHSSLGIFGALGYAMGLSKISPLPISPSAWLVLKALQESGVAMNLTERTALETKVEDFLKDYRFSEDEESSVRLRPGWKFMTPVTFRETSKS